MVDLEGLLHLVTIDLLDSVLVGASYGPPVLTLATLKDACTVSHDELNYIIFIFQTLIGVLGFWGFGDVRQTPVSKTYAR